MSRLDELELIDGRYRLIKELGAGAFGSVHRATQVVLGRNLREVALKLFKAEVINEDNVTQQMNDALAIIDLLSQCSDWQVRQHFLTVYDLGLTQETPRRAYIAMELVSGGSLSGRLNVPFTLQGTLPYLRQIVRALAFMHEHRFVHSDLKPDNVLVFRHAGRDHIKLGDFGLAGRHSGLFGDGPRGGDMAYIAPEMLDGMAATPAADVFSLGVMLWEMLTGRNPYGSVGRSLTDEQRQDDATMRKLRRDYRREPLRLKRRDFPEVNADSDASRLGMILDIINRMLEPDLTKRYASAVAIQKDLASAFPDSSETSEAASRPYRPSHSVVSPTSHTSADNTRIEARQKLQKLKSKWESMVSLRNWPDAERLARQMITDFADFADGYRSLSDTHICKAERYADDTSDRAVSRRRAYYRQAQTALQDGIHICLNDEQRQLKLALANVCELLGDSAMASEVRRSLASE